ncbi:type I restriction endonuclease subunit S [Bacillus wiedmannii]|uniref:restriction endonuclease subunit S n=2 Tax=Bacillus wiedmannii TaxID=1890302 RepID=UPI000BEFC219|nr:restriction endonuclease subunit S [Bacillus wiedmannii]MED2882520.1 restriction endonuclease subunit S [Bacillus wiedmannii]PEN93197.1 type I restriction endonuclease subunit S [Bacillus wiedmannii]PFZ03390.1 type I restriction endonuclease subunit S [Bacillus wiedmannii]
MTWQTYALNDVFTSIKNGLSVKQSKDKEGLPITRIETISSGVIDIEKVGYAGLSVEDVSGWLLEDGDILLSHINSLEHIGKVAQYTEDLGDLVHGMNLVCLRAKREFLYPKFALYYFRTSTFKNNLLHFVNQSVNQCSISVTHLKNINILLPPVEEQKKIVTVLDKAQVLIDKRKESIAKLDELIQSAFLDMFGDLFVNPKGWLVREFDYFAKIDTKMTKDFIVYGNYPHIGIDNIEKNTGRLIHYKSVKEDRLVSNKYIFTEEHIIYSKIRPYLNKVALPNFKGLCSADAYPILINKENTNRYFFAYILRSKYFLGYVEKVSNRTNIPKVNKKQLEGFSCIAPPIQLQDEFANIVLNVEAYKVKLNKSLDKMEDNFNSLVQQAFKGELKVNTEITASI